MNDLPRLGAYFALFSGIGLTLIMTILPGILLGWLVDQQLNTLPIFVLVGALLGMALGAAAVARQISRFLDRFE